MDPALTLELLNKDIQAGSVAELHGGLAEAQARWGDRLAAGKLGVVRAQGRKARLIGDGTVSGANSASAPVPSQRAVLFLLARRRRCLVGFQF